MHRLIVAFLAAFDAVIAAAVGVAATLAPLTLLWIFGFGGAAPWSLLWPASASVWQLGHLVPLHIALPPEYLAATGIAQDAASFVLSLAPLAFAGFTAIFAARSGARASRADAWITGVVVGTVVFGVLAALVAVTARNGLAAVFLWQAVLLPVVVFAVPAVVGAVVTEWREAGAGIVARVRDRVEVAPRGWGAAPALVVRGAGVVLGGLVGAGALVVAIAAVAGGDDVIALFEAGNVDLVGIVVVALGQLAYLPTLVVWGMSFVAGPGFAVGVGTSVSPSGTQLGVVPGIPVLGALPESTSTWLLLVALVPVALGAFAGWIARSRLVATEPRDHEPALARAAIAAGIAVVSAAGAALLAVVASGSMGPGRLSEAGPQPGPVALAVGVEVIVGAAILLLSPHRAARANLRSADAPVDASPLSPPGPTEPAAVRGVEPGGAETSPAAEPAAPRAAAERADAAAAVQPAVGAADAATSGIRTPPPPLPPVPRVPRHSAVPTAEPDADTAPVVLPADAQDPPVD